MRGVGDEARGGFIEDAVGHCVAEEAAGVEF